MNHEIPSYNQITEQQETEQYATVLTGRSNGAVETAKYVGQLSDGKYYVELNEKDETGRNKLRSISPYDLSDAGQAALAEELAMSADRTPEQMERYHEEVEEIGEAAVEAVEVEQVLASVAEKSVENTAVRTEEKEAKRIELKPENIERSARELDRVRGGRLEVALRGIEGDPEALRAAIDPNTGNEQRRAEVLEALRLGIDDLGAAFKLPERVQYNSPDNLKNIPSNRFGYEKQKYLSRDYAALVALAMLDGSYDGDPRKVDFDDLPADDPRNGQHRQAARMVLDNYAEQKRSHETNEMAQEASEEWQYIRRQLDNLREQGEMRKLQGYVMNAEVDTAYLARQTEMMQADLYSLRRQIVGAELTGASEQRNRDELDQKVHSVIARLDAAFEDIQRLRRLEYGGDMSPAGFAQLREEIQTSVQKAAQLLNNL